MSDNKAKLDQIIGEAFIKATHIVLGARVTDKTSRRPSSLASKAWVRHRQHAVVSHIVLHTVQPGRGGGRQRAQRAGAMAPRPHQAPGHPDLPPPPHATSPVHLATRTTPQKARYLIAYNCTLQICTALVSRLCADILLEQWVFDYRPPSPSASPHTSQHSSASGTSQLLTRMRHEPPAVYKRLVVLMRSLYCLVRALPAHRLHCAAQRDGAAMHLRYVVLAGTPATPAHAGRMVDMAIRPVETPHGAFGASVRYQPHSVVTVLELSVGGRAQDGASDTVRCGVMTAWWCPCVYRKIKHPHRQAAQRAAPPWAAPTLTAPPSQTPAAARPWPTAPTFSGACSTPGASSPDTHHGRLAPPPAAPPATPPHARHRPLQGMQRRASHWHR